MADKTPERLRWAAEVLAPGPDDRILEIGCGHGVLLSLLADKMASGTIMAIDRSDKMVSAATARNTAHIVSGKVSIRQAELAAADFASGSFDKIFAVNVNLFWIKLDRELPVARRLLAAGGRLYLFFEPPSPSQAESIAAKLAVNLEAGGFQVVREAFTAIGSARGVCVVAAPA